MEEDFDSLEMLIDSVMLMALEYEDQAITLPSFVYLPDEVVLTFADSYLAVDSLTEDHLLTEAQIVALKEIDRFLEEMQAKQQTENIFSVEAMKTSPDWQHMRFLA